MKKFYLKKYKAKISEEIKFLYNWDNDISFEFKNLSQDRDYVHTTIKINKHILFTDELYKLKHLPLLIDGLLYITSNFGRQITFNICSKKERILPYL